MKNILLEHLINKEFCHPQLADITNSSVTGEGRLPSWYNLTDLVVASFSIAGGALIRYSAGEQGSEVQGVVDQRLANLWFNWTLKPEGWDIVSSWDALAGNYPTQNGWIRLHTNAPHHRACALEVLSCDGTQDAVRAAVQTWDADTLEQVIVNAGGCAAKMRSQAEWSEHSHGKYLSQEPLIQWRKIGTQKALHTQVDPLRPLGPIKILDLTRVLAGPVAGRFLAGFGANVLRIDPQDWNEPGVIPEVTLGKRCAGLNLKAAQDRRIFETLIKDSDVLIHGYRFGALNGLGYDSDTLHRLNPNMIDVCLNAYGWNGPWAQRRGFDSLVQMSCGITDYGMKQSGATSPVPLPVQGLDHATGYLMAAAVLQALELRNRTGDVMSARLSLAATAEFLKSTQRATLDGSQLNAQPSDYAPETEQTHWGPAKRIRFPFSMDTTPVYWDHPASDLRTSKPTWT